MTAISPLQSIHKKGIFGDHHKQNESDLLKITEVKNINIVQIVQYKNSKLSSSKIKIDDLEITSQSSKVLSNEKTRIFWSGPRTWLIVSDKENIIDIVTKNCDNENFAITDISHSRAVIQIKGIKAKEVLKKGCPINFNEIEKNNCVSSVYNGITILIDCLDDKTQIFNLFTLRSFGESFYHHITDASLEFGYVGA